MSLASETETRSGRDRSDPTVHVSRQPAIPLSGSRKSVGAAISRTAMSAGRRGGSVNPTDISPVLSLINSGWSEVRKRDSRGEKV